MAYASWWNTGPPLTAGSAVPIASNSIGIRSVRPGGVAATGSGAPTDVQRRPAWKRVTHGGPASGSVSRRPEASTRTIWLPLAFAIQSPLPTDSEDGHGPPGIVASTLPSSGLSR